MPVSGMHFSFLFLPLELKCFETLKSAWWHPQNTMKFGKMCLETLCFFSPDFHLLERERLMNWEPQDPGHRSRVLVYSPINFLFFNGGKSRMASSYPLWVRKTVPGDHCCKGVLSPWSWVLHLNLLAWLSYCLSFLTLLPSEHCSCKTSSGPLQGAEGLAFVLNKD